MPSAECYPDKAPKVNDLMNTLGDDVRREVIYYFEKVRNTDDTATIDEVVTHIIARIPETKVDEIRLSLLHVHLPKLEKRGWIEYDSRSGDILYLGHGSAYDFLSELGEIFTE